MDPSFDFLVFPNDSSTPTTDTFSFPSFSLDTDDPALPSASAWEDSAQLDPLLYQQAFADGNPYAEEFDTGGIELGAIAPLPGLLHSYPPPAVPAPFPNPYSTPRNSVPQVEYDPAPSPSSHHSSLVHTPPSNDSPSLPPNSKRLCAPKSLVAFAHSETPHIYAGTSEGSTTGSPELNHSFALPEDEEAEEKAGSAPAAGKGKKRKQLPSTKEFQHPDVTGLSKKEARLVKNRAAAFLSRQRKREQFDEMAVHVEALEAENARLKALLPSSTSTSSTPSTSYPAIQPPILIETARLQADLANLRTLLHQSTSREAKLEVELASLRSQLQNGMYICPSCSSGKSASQGGRRDPSPMLSGGLELGRVGAKRTDRDRTNHHVSNEGKRVGGVALMVILFSFALFTFPSTGGLSSSLNTPSTSSFPNYLGRVLSSSGYRAVSFGSSTTPSEVLVKKDEEEDEMEGVCEMGERNNATIHPTFTNDSCVSPSQPTASSTKETQLDTWRSIPSPSTSSSSSLFGKKSLSLTLLRPIPSSAADLNLFRPVSPSSTKEDAEDEGVNSILQKWLGLNLGEGVLFDEGGRNPFASDDGSERLGLGLGLGGSEGWVLVDSNPIDRSSAEKRAAAGEVEAWDGTPLEKMELDQFVQDAFPEPFEEQGVSSPTPSLDSVSSTSTVKPYAHTPAEPASSLLTLPSSAASSDPSSTSVPGKNGNGTFVRLDLELEIDLKRRDVSLVGREEVGRLLKSAKRDEGLKGLPGSWGVI